MLRAGIHENHELQKDFNQYGESHFLFQKLVFGTGLEKEDRRAFETMILVTLRPEQRYNVYTNWLKRGSLSNPFLGKRHTPESREAMSVAKKGKKSSFFGHVQSDLVKHIISQENTGKVDRKKPLSIDGVFFESVTHASQVTGLSRRLIRERCHSNEKRFETSCWVSLD
jgi:hypothetical protein